MCIKGTSCLQDYQTVHLKDPISWLPDSPPRSDLNLPYLRGEHSGTGPDAPADHGLGEAALLDALADLVLLSAP